MKINPVLHTLFTRLGGAIFSLLAVVITSKYLGAEGRGELSLILAALNIFILVNDFGGGSALVNLAPNFKPLAIMKVTYLWALVVNSSGYFILLFIFPKLSAFAFSIALMGMMLSVITVNYSLLQGNKQIKRRNLLQIFLEGFKFCGLALIFYFFEATVKNAVMSTLIALMLIMVWSLLLVFKLNSSNKSKLIKFGSKQLRNTFMAQLAQVVQFFNYRFSFFIIVSHLGNFNLGLYSNCLVVADAVWMIGNSLGTVAHMRMVNSANETFKVHIAIRYLKISILLTLFAGFVLFLLPVSFWILLLGSDFGMFRDMVMLMIPAILALGWSTLISHYFHAQNMFLFLLFCNTIGFIVQLLTLLLLIDGSMGIFAAPVSASVGFITIATLVTIRFIKLNKIAFESLLPGIATLVYLKRYLKILK